MNPSQLQNEEKKHEWTIVYDRAVPPAHSATFAASSSSSHVRKPTKKPQCRRGVTRTLTPPASRWVEPSSTSTENASEPPQSSSPVSQTIFLPKETITKVVAKPCLSTPEHTNDAGPRLPQRIPAGSVLSPAKKSP